MSDFVHLHVHTQYSLLQGAIWADALAEKAGALGMKAVAITDTHGLFGAIDFYTAAKKAGVKPIIGCEIFYAPNGRATQVQGAGSPATQNKPKVHQLVLLCKNLKGYQNLCQMVTRSYLDTPPPQKGEKSFGPRSVIDRALLSKWGDDLVVLSGDIRGEISYKLLTGETEEAIESLKWFKERFKDDFYLEVLDTGLPEQEQVNEELRALAEKYGVGLVATANAHYLSPEDAEAHEILQCIEVGKNLDFDRPKSLVPPEFYLKPPALMRERFERFPGACDNTLAIADKCDLVFKFKDEKGRAIYHLPNFRPDNVAKDEPFDLIGFFRKEAREGLEKRFQSSSFEAMRIAPDWAEKQKTYWDRLESELAMIEKTGFSGYFLIVSDFIRWAKANSIPVGPGRGSGAGSLVAYSLEITDIDPILFKLLFERFINPERISMPDFDVDFCQDRRGEVIDYVSRKYGAENVCQIITFGKLQARAAIKDVGRVLGLSFADTDIITKLLPDEIDITIESALKREPRIRERMDADPRIAQVIEYALKLEGLYRNAGIHAAGVIITENPVVTYCPLFMSKDGDVTTQFDKDFSEQVGLVKFDFLGLKTLTVIDNAVKLIRHVAEPGSLESSFTLEKINYSDPKVFALISSGDTDGVFQVESSGMKDLCMGLQPGSLEDITAINALYRPGPLGSGMVDDFIDRKHGRKPVVYDVPALESILIDTYGVILYQEQVMQIARELAGYSLGQADLLRRAMGKKKAEEMAQHRELFVKGATSKGLDPAKAEGIFDLMAKFAEYGFNKSHSAAYGVLTYQTAYLKAYYPAEFMAALMTTEMDNTDKITKYINDAKSHGIAILPPDVNFSQKRFSVERQKNDKGVSSKAVRFGLEAVKGVGGIAVDTILEGREAGRFENVLDFCRRVSTRKVNKKVLESLTLAGAFDSIAEVNRASLFASLEDLLKHAGDEQEERALGQSSLFDSFTSEEVKLVSPISTVFKKEEDWPMSRKLAQEKQVVGFYVSGHPLDHWQKICEEWLGWNTERIKSHAADKNRNPPQAAAPPEMGSGGGRFRAPKQEIKLVGLIGEMREVMTKKGSRMAFGSLEDLYGRLEVVFFPESYAENQEMLKRATTEAEAIVITADLETADEAPKLLVKNIEWAHEAHKGRVQHITLKIAPNEVSPAQLRELKKHFLMHRGKCHVRIDFVDPKFKTFLELPKTVAVSGTPQMVQSINKIFGKSIVQLR